MTKIGIVGLGFVGDAIYHSLSTKDTEKVTVIGYDKFKHGGIGTIESLLDCEILFICLPTPFNDESKSYEMSAFTDVLGYLSEQKYQGLLLVKSTVTPTTCQKFVEQYDLKIIHNPEFLSARTARKDFEQQSHVVLGTTSKVSSSEINKLVLLYEDLFPQARISVVKSIESESMKMFVNNFYAAKVQLFTEFFLLCKELNADYETVVDLMMRNGWISPHHTKVPGPDGQVSYGGFCFPKDTQALLAMMKEINTPHQVLDAVVNERNTMRDD